MKKYIITLLLIPLGFMLFGQDKDKTPVRSPYDSEWVIDNQTWVIPTQNNLNYVIQHRFGTIENGHEELWGIYAPGANIRMGMNYSRSNRVNIGMGITKKNMYTDLNLKWNILEQTRSGSMPVALTYYGNMAIDGRPDENFGVHYTFNNRFSYFSELIVTRKYTDWLTLAVGGRYSHYNTVDSAMDHDRFGLHFNGRVKFSPQSAFIFQYDQPLGIESASEHNPAPDPAKPNFGFGIEIATSTHAFQIFVASADGLLPQDNMMFNTRDISKKQWMLGFVITRLWSF